MAGMQAVFNALERDLIAERTTDALAELKRRGRAWNRHPVADHPRLWVDAPMAAMPPLEALAALLAIDTDDPADADDLTVLRELLARREARATAEATADARRSSAPNLPVVE